MRLYGGLLMATLVASSALAAPSSEQQHPYLVDESSSMSYMLSSAPAAPLFSWIHSALDKVMPSSASQKSVADAALQRDPQYASLDRPDYSASSIWEVIQKDEHLSDLRKVLKYSGPGARKLLDDKSKKLTFLAPVNWHHDKHIVDADAPESFKTSHWSKIESQIDMLENANESTFKDDEEKEHRRKAIAYLIDATLEYHAIKSKEPLKAWDVSQNSSVATLLSIGDGPARKVLGNLLDGTPFRVRVGKSLLPRPSAYFNFYSRLVYPDVSVGDGSIVHAISLPLFIPPSALQTLFFSSPDLAGTTVALQKTHTESYFRFPINHSAIHHHDSHVMSHRSFLEMEPPHSMKHSPKQPSNHSHDHHDHHFGKPQPDITLFAPGNVAWYRLPVPFRLFLLSPWGTRILGKVLALHSLPQTIFYADFVHERDDHFQQIEHATVPAGELTGSPEWLWGPRSESPAIPFGDVDVTKYTFNSALPKLEHHNHTHHNDFAAAFANKDGKMKFETVDVNVYRYKILPGGRGPLQTRVSVQGVPVTFQDIAVGNGAVHVIERFIMPKGHPHKGLWAEAAVEAEKYGFGSVDLTTARF